MYFPYLRGKQFELVALRELQRLLAQTNRVTPILEPVRRAEGSLSKIARIASNVSSIIIVENPGKGDFGGDHRPIQQLFSGPLSSTVSAVPGYIVHPGTRAAHLEAFFRRHSDRVVAFLHFGSLAEPEELIHLQQRHGNTGYNIFLEGKSSRAYMASFRSVTSVLLEDRFERRARNEDYPAREFFSDRHKTYQEDGFDGFGDFLIVGNYYTEGGGPAHAVAIHLTNKESNDDIDIRHFVSDRTRGTADIPGKFMEALNKTVRFIRSGQNYLLSDGCREFLDLHQRQHFPGLGFVKKISMKHHVELMDAVLRAQGNG